MSDLHTIKFLLITSPNSPSHRAFTIVVKALWDGELGDAITKNFMVPWGGDIRVDFVDLQGKKRFLRFSKNGQFTFAL